MTEWPPLRRFDVGRRQFGLPFALHSVHETRIAAEREALIGQTYRIVSSENPREDPDTGEFGRYALYFRPEELEV